MNLEVRGYGKSNELLSQIEEVSRLLSEYIPSIPASGS